MSKRRMKKAEILADFVECYDHESIGVLKARIKEGRISKTTTRCQLLDYVDYLAKNGDITEKQSDNFICPSWLY